MKNKFDKYVDEILNESVVRLFISRDFKSNKWVVKWLENGDLKREKFQYFPTEEKAQAFKERMKKIHAGLFEKCKDDDREKQVRMMSMKQYRDLQEGKKFDRCVKKVKKQGDVDNPYAVCNASLNKKKKINEAMSESSKIEKRIRGIKNNLAQFEKLDLENPSRVMKQKIMALQRELEILKYRQNMNESINEGGKCDGPTKKASSTAKGKKWMKCVKQPDGKYKRVHWGQKGVKVTGKSGNTKRKKSFRARHKCSQAKKGSAQAQACKDW